MCDPFEPSESTYYRRLKKRRVQELEESSGDSGSENDAVLQRKSSVGVPAYGTPASSKHRETDDFRECEADEAQSYSSTSNGQENNSWIQFKTASELDQSSPADQLRHSEGSGGISDCDNEDVHDRTSVSEDEENVNTSEEESGTGYERNSDIDSSECEVNEENSDGDVSEPEGNEKMDAVNLGDCNLDTIVNLASGVRARDMLLLTLGLSVRHNWSYENIINHFTCQNTLIDLPCLPQSKEKLWRVISCATTELEYHAYCNSCYSYLGLRKMLNVSSVCNNQNCKAVILRSNVKYFITLNLRKQLQRFLSLPHIAEYLKYPHVREKKVDNAIQDIFDGAEYRRLVDENIVDPNVDFTYIFNTDGVKILKGAKSSAYPLYVRLNELPPNLRQKHLFLAAVWVDQQEPDMNCFLKPFVDEANDLSTEGVRWKPDGINEVVSKFIPLGQCVDSKARWTLFNMTQYNGKFGCVVCDVNGKWSALNMRYPVLPPHGTSKPNVRTEENLVADMITAQTTQQVILGVKGVSVMMNLKHFRMTNGCGMDDLHTLYEGCAKHHTDLLMSLKGTTTYVLRETVISERLKLMKTPSSISRKHGDIKKRGSWKGSEWRNWLLFYCCVCMKDMIPQKYLHHIALLSHATFLMCQDEIHPNNLELIHSLLVKNLGPLWCYSTFNFESWNRKCVSQHVHSPKGAAQQIAHRHLIKNLVNYYIDSGINVSPSTVEQLKCMLRKTRNITQSVGHIHFLGPKISRQATGPERKLLEEAGYVGVEIFSEYPQVLHKSVVYSTAGFVNSKALSDDSVVYTWADSICTIVSFVIFVCENLEVCGVFVWEHYVESLESAKHIAKMTSNEKIFHFLTIDEIRSPVVIMKIGEDKYVGALPNNYEID